jgi:hypothetical protein
MIGRRTLERKLHFSWRYVYHERLGACQFHVHVWYVKKLKVERDSNSIYQSHTRFNSHNSYGCYLYHVIRLKIWDKQSSALLDL